MFLRAKKIKGIDYAYIVENSWKNGAKQKVKGYIGKIYGFEFKESTDFLSFLGISNIGEYIKNNDNKKVIMDLVKWEFFRHNIDDGEFLIGFEDKDVKKNGKNICIRINGGFLCSVTLKNLMEFKTNADESHNELSFRLGRAFVEAGIAVPEELFIALFEKIKGKGDLSAFEGFYY